jgi:hypothetical protein
MTLSPANPPPFDWWPSRYSVVRLFVKAATERSIRNEPNYAQSDPDCSPEHEVLKADHQAMKTVLTNLAFTVEHLPACSK